MTKTTLSLSFQENQALYHFLLQLMTHSKELQQESRYIKMQLEILGEVLEKKVHPKALIDTGKLISFQLKSFQVEALQLAMVNGWLAKFISCFYTQNALRNILINKLPAIPVINEDQIAPPDIWN